MVYVTQKYSINETIKHVGEHEIKELIQKELYAAEEKRRLKEIIKVVITVDFRSEVFKLCKAIQKRTENKYCQMIHI